MLVVTGLGDRLREARTTKGYSLDDLQAITKIQKRYLSGIENEEYGMMPGSFYVRAFIKQYAEAVGLDPDEMLTLYKDTTPSQMPAEESAQASAPPMSRRRGLQNRRLNEMMPKVIVALFIIFIVVAFWFLYQWASTKPVVEDAITEPPLTTVEKNQSNNNGQPENNPGGIGAEPDGDDETEVPEPEPEPEPEVVEQTLANVSVNGEDAIYSLTDADKFLLEIQIDGGDSWIGVLDATRQERMAAGATTMSSGQQVELDVSDTESIRIRVGRTQFTKISVNGQLLEYASDRITQNIIIEYKKGE